MKDVILLDMDGVICNFVDGLISSMGLPITHEQYTSWNHHHTLGYTDEQMWEHTRVGNWWENLEPYPWAHYLVDNLRNIGEIIYCTSPSRCSSCPSQKVTWLRKHGFMDENKNDYQIGPKKELNAASGAVLIDDSEDNVRKYRDAGGRAILFPQPWNKCGEIKSSSDKLEYVLLKMKYHKEMDND